MRNLNDLLTDTMAHAGALITNLDELANHRLYRHSLKQAAKFFLNKLERYIDTVHEKIPEEDVEKAAIKIYLGTAEEFSKLIAEIAMMNPVQRKVLMDQITYVKNLNQ